MATQTDGQDDPLIPSLTYLEQAEATIEDNKGGRDSRALAAAGLLLDFSKAKSLQNISDCLIFICDDIRGKQGGEDQIAAAINNLATVLHDKHFIR